MRNEVDEKEIKPEETDKLLMQKSKEFLVREVLFQSDRAVSLQTQLKQKDAEIAELKNDIKKLVVNAIEDNRTLRDLCLDEDDMDSYNDYQTWLIDKKRQYIGGKDE